jgi:radical SAM superfamily enzyme YgiQ (UPF0313 family)
MSTVLPLETTEPQPTPRRDTSRSVVLIGFQEHANLGLGYLAAVLRRQGYAVHIFDFEQDADVILAAVRRVDPVLVGFSLIFQFYIRRFQSLMAHLRQHGVTCHFTMGGHFPSLSQRETLMLAPELDSVVRFEGEMTLLEMVDRLGTGEDWRDIRGIAYRRGDEVVDTPLRPLIHDLDDLPHPVREGARTNMVLGRRVVPLLASRGCARTCSFCSIHMFYRSAPGRVVRTRRPAEVVREMRELYDETDATIFLFQDDDFPLYGPVWRRWTSEFLGELDRQGLVGRAIWKINCRADAVDRALFAEMREAGLYLVYIGLESGSDAGLETLHKQITVAQNVRAIDTLKELGLLFDFGFMMFDPSTTFETVRENVAFLRRIVGDGSAGAVFCRMIPYDGTPIKDALVRDGRFRGDVCHPDYDFLDPRVSAFYESLSGIVDRTGWIHGHRALSPELNFIWHELAVLQRLFPVLPDLDGYREALRAITRDSNDLLLRVVEDVNDAFADGRPSPWSASMLVSDRERFLDGLLRTRNTFIGRHQRILLDALQQPVTPVCA